MQIDNNNINVNVNVNNNDSPTIDNEFIKAHAPIVRTIARQYRIPNVSMRDLMQEGYIYEDLLSDSTPNMENYMTNVPK